MRVTVEVVGEETHDVRVDDDATYGDLLDPLDVSHHEVSVLVDGRPVPEDERVDADHVRVLRLIKGGAGPGRSSGPHRPTPADSHSKPCCRSSRHGGKRPGSTPERGGDYSTPSAASKSRRAAIEETTASQAGSTAGLGS